MKVCLINIYYRQEDYPNRYSLSVLRLAEYLKSFNYEVDMFPIDLNNYKNFDIQNILNKKYDLIGFSTYSWVKDAVLFLDRKIKEKDKNVNIVIGGAEVDNINLDEFTNEYFIIGEGEKALKNLCEYINNGKKDKLFFKNNTNIFNKVNNEHLKLENPIDVINPLFTNINIPDKDFLWYETCRGCAFNCGYCGHKTRKQVEYIDLDIVKQEIINIGKMGFKNLFVIDPNFAGTKERAKQVLTYFNKYAPNATIGLYFRPEFIDDEMIKILSDANISHVRIGIQTTNSNVPKWIRSNNISKILTELPKLSPNGINWRGELITGLPGDNMKGLMESIKFMEQLNPTEYFSYHLTLIPNTPLYELKDNFDNPLWITADEYSRANESSTYSHNELLDMLEYAKNKETEYNNKVKVKRL